MTILYEDQYLTCDEDAITIHWYYFPFGSKRIPYSKIRNIRREEMNFWTGSKGRIWGMGLTPEWFHCDIKRPGKDRCITIDDGEWVKSVITPDDCDRVFQILLAQTSLS
ncbi:hypothetical protein IQ249_10270 [Lusitaniella coriacea LEGE 07157]|uniref:Uncharacterized protein n=1 Tax=Lusitaniella coriacea LEGE 07157 TaxID=945747 RepID=A0A8J7DW84_9CYAN|nr:hypothetical protein [Lusitaniella coriacea]MBE9116281.1 hypothetical protein [Lusitaniella coriacea LEGE 07157]